MRIREALINAKAPSLMLLRAAGDEIARLDARLRDAEVEKQQLEAQCLALQQELASSASTAATQRAEIASLLAQNRKP